ncbi:MAG: sugar nucleotide-binding protein, partial [Deltaproteobacteria bacterium]|nr:sugar nucleotide-binding protein [Deltaproteobacteria bacterium]
CEYPLPAPRPAYSLLSKEKYRAATRKTVPSWQDALARYLDRRFGKTEGARPDETVRI